MLSDEAAYDVTRSLNWNRLEMNDILAEMNLPRPGLEGLVKQLGHDFLEADRKMALVLRNPMLSLLCTLRYFMCPDFKNPCCTTAYKPTDVGRAWNQVSIEAAIEIFQKLQPTVKGLHASLSALRKVETVISNPDLERVQRLEVLAAAMVRLVEGRIKALHMMQDHWSMASSILESDILQSPLSIGLFRVIETRLYLLFDAWSGRVREKTQRAQVDSEEMFLDSPVLISTFSPL